MKTLSKVQPSKTCMMPAKTRMARLTESMLEQWLSMTWKNCSHIQCTTAQMTMWGHWDGTNDHFWVSGVVPDAIWADEKYCVTPGKTWVNDDSGSSPNKQYPHLPKLNIPHLSRFTTYSYQTRSARSGLHTCCSSSCKLTWTQCSRPGVHYIPLRSPWPPFFYWTRVGGVHTRLCLIFHAHTKWFIVGLRMAHIIWTNNQVWLMEDGCFGVHWYIHCFIKYFLKVFKSKLLMSRFDCDKERFCTAYPECQRGLVSLENTIRWHQQEDSLWKRCQSKHSSSQSSDSA